MSGMTLLAPSSVTSGGAVTIEPNGGILKTGSSVDMYVNGIFSADYRTYVLYATWEPTSTTDLNLDFASGGVATGSNANYTRVEMSTYNTNINGIQNSVIPSISRGGSTGYGGGAFTCYITNPYQAENKCSHTEAFTGYSGVVPIMHNYMGFHYNSTSLYDGVRIYSGANFTGQFYFYGLQD